MDVSTLRSKVTVKPSINRVPSTVKELLLPPGAGLVTAPMSPLMMRGPLPVSTVAE